MSERILYEVWDTQDGLGHPWAAQLHGYVAYFETEAAALRYIESVKKDRASKGKK